MPGPAPEARTQIFGSDAKALAEPQPMNRLIQFALTQRVLVGLLALLLVGAGLNAFRQLPIDAFPDVSPTQVKIIVKAPGMTPEEVEARITAPIEVELLGIE